MEASIFLQQIDTERRVRSLRDARVAERVIIKGSYADDFDPLVFKQESDRILARLGQIKSQIGEIESANPREAVLLKKERIQLLMGLLRQEYIDYVRRRDALFSAAIGEDESAYIIYEGIFEERSLVLDETIERLRTTVAAFSANAVARAEQDTRRFGNMLLIVTGVATGLGLFLAILIAHGVTKLIRSLKALILKVIDGDLTGRLEPTSSDEVCQLTLGFNQMIESLQTKERIKNLFGQYVDHRVVGELIDRPDLKRGAGETHEMTFFFQT